MRVLKNTITCMLVVACWGFFLLLFESANAQYAEIESEVKFQGGKVVSMKKMIAQDTLTTITIQPGTTVIWLNDTRNVFEVDFFDKQVTLACGAPVGFFINEVGAFSSQKIIPKAVASLCFVEKGDYLFELVPRYPRGAEPVPVKPCKGKIVVQ
jgi:hypothetical protein